jgi:DNA-binding GntR family transcriptional regulator
VFPIPGHWSFPRLQKVKQVETRVGATSAAGEKESILETLRKQIATHLLPPGSKLRESELASRYNVSRARIRDAFQVLEQRGLIERVPNHGAIVVRLDADEVVQLYDVREMLEALAARLAAQQSKPATWAPLKKRFGTELEQALAEENFDPYLSAITELNRTILKQADSKILTEFLSQISDRTQIYARRVIVLPGRAKIGLKLHRRLLDALSAGDGEGAERLKREIIAGAKSHLMRFKQFVL